jgi:protein-tyrosine phosphatase
MKTILMVCLGNICRSPLAEGILRKKLSEHGIEALIDSAGTSGYHAGENPDQRSIANAKKNGVDISKLISRQFTQADFDRFEHIFVMDQNNYKDVIALARNENDKKKVNMILNMVEPGRHQPVPDPYFGGEDGFQAVHELLDEACEIIASKLKQNNL